MTLWVRRKRSVESVIVLDPKAIESGQDIVDNTDDGYIKVKMLFNSLMTRAFESSDITETMYISLYQGATWKPWNVGERFYTGSNHALAHQLS